MFYDVAGLGMFFSWASVWTASTLGFAYQRGIVGFNTYSGTSTWSTRHYVPRPAKIRSVAWWAGGAHGSDANYAIYKNGAQDQTFAHGTGQGGSAELTQTDYARGDYVDFVHPAANGTSQSIIANVYMA